MLKELIRFEDNQLGGWEVSKRAKMNWHISIPEKKRIGHLNINFGPKPKKNRGLINVRKPLTGIENGLIRVRIFLKHSGIKSGFIRLLDFKKREIIGMASIPSYPVWKEVSIIGYLSNEKQSMIDFAINLQLDFEKRKKKEEKKDHIISIKWVEVQSGPEAAIFAATRIRTLFELPKDMRISQRALLSLNYLLTAQGMHLIQEARKMASSAGRRIVLPYDIDQADDSLQQQTPHFTLSGEKLDFQNEN